MEPYFDAILQWNTTTAYFFIGDQYYRYDLKNDKVVKGYPYQISEYWPGIFSSGINAAINWGNGKYYFFKDGQYTVWDTNQKGVPSGYPKSITEGFPGLPATGIDAAVNWGNGKAYFFVGSEYYRFTVATQTMDSGYPKKLSTQLWPGVTFDRIDAAFNWQNGMAFFFRGNEYVRYDIANDRVVNSSYPALIPHNWHIKKDPSPPLSLKRSDVDAAFRQPNGQTYLFIRNFCVLYKGDTFQIAPGFPKRTSDVFSGLPENFKYGGINAAMQHLDGYCYFFSGSRYIRFLGNSTQPESSQTQSIASKWPSLPETFKSGIDAAFLHPNGKHYLFKGSQYVRFTGNTYQMDPEYPKGISAGWGNISEGFYSGINAAVQHADGDSYFFKGDMYTSFVDRATRVDSGFPKPIGDRWGQLPLLSNGALLSIDVTLTIGNNLSGGTDDKIYVGFNGNSQNQFLLADAPSRGKTYTISIPPEQLFKGARKPLTIDLIDSIQIYQFEVAHPIARDQWYLKSLSLRINNNILYDGFTNINKWISAPNSRTKPAWSNVLNDWQTWYKWQTINNRAIDLSGKTYSVGTLQWLADIRYRRTYDPATIPGVGILIGQMNGQLVGQQLSTKTCEVLKPGYYNWVFQPDGALIYRFWDKSRPRSEYVAHSQLGSGDPVLCAGEFEVKNTVIKQLIGMVNDASGHYKPDGGSCLWHVRDKLDALGVETKDIVWKWKKKKT